MLLVLHVCSINQEELHVTGNKQLHVTANKQETRYACLASEQAQKRKQYVLNNSLSLT